MQKLSRQKSIRQEPTLDEYPSLTKYTADEVTVRDTNEQNQIEKALRQSEEKYRNLFELSPYAIVTADMKGMITACNAATLKLTGYSEAEIIGKHFSKLSFLRVKDIPKYAKVLSSLIRSKVPAPFEITYYHKDGAPHWVRGHLGLLKSGDTQRCIQAVFEDITERKQMEEALAETNERLHVLQQVTKAVHSTLNLEEVFKRITDGAVHSLGYTVAFILVLNDEKKCFEIKSLSAKKKILSQIKGILGFTLKSLSVPAEPGLNAAIRAVIEGRIAVVKTLADIAYPIINKKACSALQKVAGTKNYITVPFRNEGEIVGAIFLSSPREEVSEEELVMLHNFAGVASQAIFNADAHAQTKQMEETLRESEEKLRRVFESINDGILVHDLNGIITDVNEKMVELHGLSTKDDMLGKNLLELVPQTERKTMMSRMSEELEKGPVKNIELTTSRADSSERTVELNSNVLRDASGTPVGFIGVFRDITERKQTREQLRESEEKLRLMFESITQGVTVLDLNGVVVDANQRIAEMLGYSSKNELLGTKIIETIAPDDRQKVLAALQGIPKRGRITGMELTHVRTDGSEFPGEVSSGILEDASGNPVGYISIMRDLTRRNQIEAERKEAEHKAQLASRLASIGEMASGIAHEINNPLTSVIGFSQLLMRRDIPDNVLKDLEVINNEAKRVAKIVEGLIAFAHQRQPGREYVDINSIISKVLQIRSYQMKVNNIKVVTQFAAGLPQIVADAGQLQQVFLNIILNAEKEMTTAHGGGKLSIRTEKRGNNIRVSLADNGPGIRKENLAKIFDPFFTTREVGDGTGLGLSICHGIITAHKGKIYAESEWGKGATFIVELPVAADNRQIEEAKVTGEEPWQRNGAKILVVDDEKAILDFLRRLLTERGYKVETVNRANAALERLSKESYDLILLDIKMPTMNGMEFYRRIEQISPNLTQRVIFITGDTIETATREFLYNNKAHYIAKPLDIEQLKRAINRVLTRR